MTELKKKWYVVRAISGQEAKVKLYIEKEIQHLGMQDFVSQILVPTEKVYQVRNGKKVTKERNFFPGYVMVEASLVGEVVHVIKSIPGVIGFLGAGGMGTSKDPVALRQNEVNRILGKVDEVEDTEETLGTPFIIGEGVKVMDGPFSGFTGIVEEVFEDRKKLNVTVKIFGRNTPVELNYAQVEKED